MEPRPASIFKRAAAASNTLVAMGIYIALVGWCTGLQAKGGVSAIVLIYVTPLAAMICDGAVRRGTYGMRMVSLGIRSSEGNPISMARCIGRMMTGMLLMPLLPISAVIAILDRRGRTLADLICGTAVWVEPEEPRQMPRRGFEMSPLEHREHI